MIQQQQQQQHTQTHFKKCLLSAFRAESKAFHFHLLTRTTLLVDVIWILSPVFTVQCYVSSIVMEFFSHCIRVCRIVVGMAKRTKINDKKTHTICLLQESL